MTYDPSQQYLPAPSLNYERYKRPGAKWKEFKAEWRRVHGDKPLPLIHNLPGLTGIPKRTLARLYPPSERPANDKLCQMAQNRDVDD